MTFLKVPNLHQNFDIIDLPKYQLSAHSLNIQQYKLHYTPQHVSSSTLLIIRKNNCITTASGIVTLCKQPYSMRVKNGHFSFLLCTWAPQTHTDWVTEKIVIRHVEMLEPHNAGNIILNSVQAVSYLLHLPARWFPSSYSDDALSMSDSSWLFTSLIDLCNIMSQAQGYVFGR